jgi:hypothetical protein
MEPIPQIDLNPYGAPGRWYRGNLHTHTTHSDGLCTPEEAVARYRERGYDFIALTDHGCRTPVEEFTSSGLLVLPGIEIHPGQNELGETYHLVAVGVSRDHAAGRDDDVQETIDALLADGAVVWLGHPYWAGLTVAEMIDLRGIIGIEVFNATCVPFGKGLSAVHWDDLLARGRLLWGLAVDDTHWVRADYGVAWVMLKAAELTPGAIMQALASGSFYATQGPEIHDIQATSEGIYVSCSPVRAITCVSMVGTGAQVTAPGPEESLTEAVFPLRHQARYVRFECTDERGRTAWSQPIML